MLTKSELRNLEISLCYLTTFRLDYALFGAGKVAREILDNIEGTGIRAPLFIVDNQAEQKSLCSIPVVQPCDINSQSPVEVIILASNVFQDSMRQKLQDSSCNIQTLDLSLPPCKPPDWKAVRPTKISETSKARDNLSKYCIGNGIDVGYGGDPVLPTAITMDLPAPYAKYQDNPQHLHGDAQHLLWFADNALDYLYSSHVLEDFANTTAVLAEWIRVLRPGGHLVLFLPDEQAYRQECKRQGKPPNKNHFHDNFSLDYLKQIIQDRDDVKVVHEKIPSGIYSFELVLMKTH